MKQNETSQPGGPSRIRAAGPNKRWLAIVAVTVMIPIPLAFQKWRRKHKNLEIIASETPRTGKTRGQSVNSAVHDMIDATSAMIPSSERETRYRETSRQREVLPSRKLVPVTDPDPKRLDENHYLLLIGTGCDNRQIAAATRRPKPRLNV